MKTLTATLGALAAALVFATPAIAACADENGCNNRPDSPGAKADAPQTRALKKKPKKECQGSTYCERSADTPQTRALKKKPKKEDCGEENTCR